MDVIHERCAGLDISKRDAKVCVRIPGNRPNTFRKHLSVHGAMFHDVQALRDELLAQQAMLVVMEATGDYWKPFFYGLEDGLNVILVNARHAKNLPGRKTDISDAQSAIGTLICMCRWRNATRSSSTGETRRSFLDKDLPD